MQKQPTIASGTGHTKVHGSNGTSAAGNPPGKQPWIGRPVVDILFILLPPFISLLVIILVPSIAEPSAGIPDAAWVVLVLLIDVAHVYSTLYRTYFDPGSFRSQRSLLTIIPVAGFVVAVLAYSISPLLFWKLLAYTAVFHFVRQQYGFMRVYSRRESHTRVERLIDSFTIYYATIYPILYWHLSGPKNFNWFLENDFVYIRAGWLLPVLTTVYVGVIIVYLLSVIRIFVRYREFNLPKFAVIIGTLCSWYFGIVYFNGDLAFTLLNVVSHGIPYMALVWIYGEKNYKGPGKGSRFLRAVFSRWGLVIFLGIIFIMAWIEEGIWDMAVWKDHSSLFGDSGINPGKQLLSILVPLLALPQITHYILDGFIWKIRKDEFRWKDEMPGAGQG